MHPVTSISGPGLQLTFVVLQGSDLSPPRERNRPGTGSILSVRMRAHARGPRICELLGPQRLCQWYASYFLITHAAHFNGMRAVEQLSNANASTEIHVQY